METARKLIAEIQMVLAERDAGEIDDRTCVDRIRAILDRPTAAAVSLDLLPDPEEPYET